MAQDLMEKILEFLSDNEEAHSLDLAKLFSTDHQKVIGAIKSLNATELISVENKSHKEWILTEEGEHVLKNGSHEAAVFNAIPRDTNEAKKSDIINNVPYGEVGLAKALAAKWLELVKVEGDALIKRKVETINDEVQKHLKEYQTLSDDSKKEYKRRKLIKENIIKTCVIRKGKYFSTKIEKPEADLTSDLLVNEAWKTKKFKPINLDALGASLDIGHLHPLLQVRSEFRKIFLEMGFQEMPTNNYVESSFWNFDALFQPQQHPARDAHDTFFISEPARSSNFPEDYLQKVKKVHSQGGYGSQGYQYDWKVEEAQKNLLRTHTTAVSARMLYKLMQKGKFSPVRYFSIDRVFRNETLDATHLAEFHQIEGIVADYDLTLGDLIGTLYEFFSKLGITRLEFKPAYNPYTEPSMEIFCFHEGLGKWIEIGNSGIFRPEMLLPMGLPENVNVIAWGLSLERPTMIKYGLNNIRDLVGPKVDLEMVQNNPLCRLTKYTDSNSTGTSDDTTADILHSKEVNIEVNEDIIIFCNPSSIPHYLIPLLNVAQKVFTVHVSLHTHSSTIESSSSKDIIEFNRNLQKIIYQNANFSLPKIKIVLIWTKSNMQCSQIRLKMSRVHEIVDPVNVIRCFSRLIESKKPELLRYESLGPEFANKIDSLLNKIEVSKNLDENYFKKFCKKEMTGELRSSNTSLIDILCN